MIEEQILKPLEIADYVFCPHKKINSRTIRNSGALIVIVNLGRFLSVFKIHRTARHASSLSAQTSGGAYPSFNHIMIFQKVSIPRERGTKYLRM
jgi:hypothetical protein